ncbi:MAG: drug/metabolite transporter (DMT)-like permease [Rubritalea sp.]|jgi:drug/metabolite transporter (DMT)-like permease|tara:strand:+ start:1181 stop:2062 length:882 start_codon:yes stop_codon:yes gene_type:complete
MTDKKPYFKLQLIVFIAAFTAVLGELITLPAYSLVIWRTGIAAVLLGLWIRGEIITFKFKRVALFTGLILGAHWMTFFGAVNLANISICLTGMATASLFTAATEAIQEKRLPYKHEIWLGLLIIPGIILIAGVERGHLSGLLCGILSALFAAIFPVINKSLVRKGAAAESITFYEMLGAMIACALFSIIVDAEYSHFVPIGMDWLWLVVLAAVCTVYAFSLYVNLLKSFSAYESTLAMNFEPVYGIILAAVFFAEHEKLHPLFFIGAGTIILANLFNPVFAKRKQTRITQSMN